MVLELREGYIIAAKSRVAVFVIPYIASQKSLPLYPLNLALTYLPAHIKPAFIT